MDLSRFLQAVRQGCVDPWQVTVHWKDSPSPPPPPDYSGAAQATAAGNLEAARLATKANRVSQYTPYGNLTYTGGVNGDPDQWRADYSLSPVGQQLLDYQNAASLGLGSQTTQALGRVDDSLAQPFDYGSVQDVQDQAYSTLTSRLDPQWQQADSMNDTKLRNQGLMPGSEAYETARREFNQAKNDAYQQANMAAINLSPQTFQMASALRSQPLNELNALRTGAQVTNPTFQQAPQQATTAGPNYLAAAQGQYGNDLTAYNIGQAGQNAMMGGLFQLGGAVAGSPWFGKMLGKAIG